MAKTPAAEPAADTRQRISFYVDKDSGALDPKTKDETLAVLRKSLGTDGTRLLLGEAAAAVPVAAAPSPADVQDMAVMVGALIGMVNGLEVTMARAFGVEATLAQSLALTDPEKDAIVKAAIPVLAKYHVSFGAYEAEFALGFALLPVAMRHAQLLRGEAPKAQTTH